MNLKIFILIFQIFNLSNIEQEFPISQKYQENLKSEIHFEDFILKVELENAQDSNYETLSKKFINLDYEKFIPQNLTGLHRKLNYSLEFQIPLKSFNKVKYQEKKCFIAIVDFCPNDFYIDSEEINSDEYEYWENEKMNIEQMKTFSKKYLYFFKIPMIYSNSFIQEDSFFFVKRILIDFHLRYGNANYIGFTKHLLNPNFDIISNCFNFEQKDNLPKTKKFEILRKQLKTEENLIVINLDKNKENIIYEIPVGNLVFLELVQYSTLISILIGMIYLSRKFIKSQLIQFQMFIKSKIQNFLKISITKLKQKINKNET